MQSTHISRVNGKLIELTSGDITRYDTQLIVVPTNIDFGYDRDMPSVQGAIVRAAGTKPFEEAIEKAKKIAQEKGIVRFREMDYDGFVQPFQGVITDGGRLNGRSLLHLVSKNFIGNKGPEDRCIVFPDGSYVDYIAVRESTRSALNLAHANGFDTVAFPALGAGMYGVPIEESVEDMVGEFVEHLIKDQSVKRIGLILYGESNYHSGLATFKRASL